jgi:Uncharacterized protein conserved in bacteria
MKQRFLDKLMISLCGLMLFAVSMLIFLWSFGFTPTAWSAVIPDIKLSLPVHILVAAIAFVLMLLGMYCFLFLFRNNNGKKGFVLQKTDNGQLSISIRAMENLVAKCIDQHEEIKIVSSGISNTRDGVVVNLRIGLANGVSIPLAVNALQKQIKQYIQACSGIEVKEVRVQVETASAKATDSAYMVHDSFLKAEESAPTVIKEVAASTETKETVPPSAPAERPAPPISVEEEEDESEERKPLHQRLFGKEQHRAQVPLPPAPTEEEAAAEDIETEAETKEEAHEDN